MRSQNQREIKKANGEGEEDQRRIGKEDERRIGEDESTIGRER